MVSSFRLVCAATSSSHYETRKLPEKSPAWVASDRSIVKSCSSGSPANQAGCFVQPLHPLKTLETNVWYCWHFHFLPKVITCGHWQGKGNTRGGLLWNVGMLLCFVLTKFWQCQPCIVWKDSWEKQKGKDFFARIWTLRAHPLAKPPMHERAPDLFDNTGWPNGFVLWEKKIAVINY